MASKATILQDTPGAIVIQVDHLDTDSFHRSVDAAATRARRRSVHRNTVTHVGGCYAFTGYGRKCTSIIAFATSFEAADALIAQHQGKEF